ncbi:MAG: TIGR00645 family protein [Alphaproteobacteria bacterium]|nr:TIGR00645 family protein [Alphaproteobacteria bacterium]
MIRKKLAPIEKVLEKTVFVSRWLLVPFYLGLVLALFGLVVQFAIKLYGTIPHILDMGQTEAILVTVAMIDMSLTGNLVVMVIFAGYENFVSKIDLGESAARPDWMGTITFSDMKLKLMASIVAISAIHVLEAFMDLDRWGTEKLAWLVGIHMVFIVSALLMAWMEKINHADGHANNQTNPGK